MLCRVANEEVQRLARIRMQVTGETFDEALAALEGRSAGTGREDRPEPEPDPETVESAAGTGATVIDLAGRGRTAGTARESRRRTPARPRRTPGAANGQQQEERG